MRRKLTEDQVWQVIVLWEDGWGEREIALRIDNASETIVRDILRGKTYRDITGGRRRMRGKRPKQKLAIYSGGLL